MKKFFVLAALLMATTSAHAGGFSFQIEGQRVRIEAPRGCASLSCISVTAPGMKGKSTRDDDDVAPARAETGDTKSKRYVDDDDAAPGKSGYKGYKSKRYNEDTTAAVPAAPAPPTEPAAAAPAPAPTTYAAAP